MTPAEFRQQALKLQGAEEKAHMGHPDFRVGTKIFATMGYPDKNFAMVKLTPEQQEIVTGAEPEIFSAAKGAWGRQGSTLVTLARLDKITAASALKMAWDNLQKPPPRKTQRGL
jgi:hypothetical protein